MTVGCKPTRTLDNFKKEPRSARQPLRFPAHHCMCLFDVVRPSFEANRGLGCARRTMHVPMLRSPYFARRKRGPLKNTITWAQSMHQALLVFVRRAHSPVARRRLACCREAAAPRRAQRGTEAVCCCNARQPSCDI